MLVTVSTGGSSTLRGHAWRVLRGLGAVYVQQSACLLPAAAEPLRAVQRLLDRVRREGGEARLLRLTLTQPDDERSLIEAFQAARQDEYAEFCSRVPAFLDEIEMERGRGRATYAEVEESEADLERLRRWLARIGTRDYFDAPGGSEARAALARCEAVFLEFESEALNAETGDRRTRPPSADGRRGEDHHTDRGGRSPGTPADPFPADAQETNDADA